MALERLLAEELAVFVHHEYPLQAQALILVPEIARMTCTELLGKSIIHRLDFNGSIYFFGDAP